MWAQAADPATWIARAANVTASIRVAETGKMRIAYQLNDVLDLIPDWEDDRGTKSGYNYIVTVLGNLWHIDLRANPIKTSSNWGVVIDNDD